MSFKFDFDIEDADDTVVVPVVAHASAEAVPAAASSAERAAPAPCKSISLADLSISYSPLEHPLGGTPLLRRDLYDARFQLAAADEEADAAQQEKEYVDADTDLIPGTYEGGLKSWEGGVDLVEVLCSGVARGEAVGSDKGKGKRKESGESEEEAIAAWVRGARVLEVGCGTGLPSAYLLRALLSVPVPAEGDGTEAKQAKTVLHLQDYNLPVLSLVTLPNLVLAALPALPESARGAAKSAPEEGDAEAGEGDDEDPFSSERAGTMDLTPALLDAFSRALEDHAVELRFTHGDWSGMARALADDTPYNLVLTAETIYAEESVGPLLDVLRAAAPSSALVPSGGKQAADKDDASLEDSLSALSVRDTWAKGPLVGSDPLVLVAAKVLYFGVGGGLDSFLARVGALGGWSTRVRDWVRGVGRAVVRVGGW